LRENIKPRLTLNPYRYAAFLIYHRLLWDINPESWRSRKILQGYKEKYYGQKAIIVCNGPSLIKSDLSLLKNIFTFGLNKINLIFDKSDFRPSCIVAVNPFIIDQNQAFFNTTDIRLFLNSDSAKYIHSRQNITFLHTAEQKKFAQDCSFSIYKGNTVTFVAIQIAFHMGFSEVALIGCDHNYATQGPPNKTAVSISDDGNHFDPNYFTKGEHWQLPDLLQSEVAYTMAKYAYEENGRRIFNATDGGMLEVFPRIPLENFLSSF
jgi:hypothetical protein